MPIIKYVCKNVLKHLKTMEHITNVTVRVLIFLKITMIIMYKEIKVLQYSYVQSNYFNVRHLYFQLIIKRGIYMHTTFLTVGF